MQFMMQYVLFLYRGVDFTFSLPSQMIYVYCATPVGPQVISSITMNRMWKPRHATLPYLWLCLHYALLWQGHITHECKHVSREELGVVL